MGCLGIKVAIANRLSLVDEDTLIVGLPKKFIVEMQAILEKMGRYWLRTHQGAQTVAGKSAWLWGALP